MNLTIAYTVDGEMQLNFALDKNLRDKTFAFNKIKGKDVNTIIFPNLSSGNIAYKLPVIVNYCVDPVCNSDDGAVCNL